MNAGNKLILLLALIAGPKAWAWDERMGLNFGTSLRMISADDRTSGQADSSTRTISSGQQVTPYLGYAFSSMNIGLALNMETSTTETIETNSATGVESSRLMANDARGLSAFFRFNFGRVMFLEAGAGLYTEDTQVKNETRSSQNGGTFVGQREEYKVKGTGPGYHMGGGIELPIADGFQFTSAYLVRVFQLRDVTSGGEVGKRRGFEQKRELTFGLAHYVN